MQHKCFASVLSLSVHSLRSPSLVEQLGNRFSIHESWLLISLHLTTEVEKLAFLVVSHPLVTNVPWLQSLELSRVYYHNQEGSITSVKAIYVAADDLTDLAPATTFVPLDATKVLSHQISDLGSYPAFDPLDSTSCMLSHILGEHYNIAHGVRNVLQNYKNLQDIIAI